MITYCLLLQRKVAYRRKLHMVYKLVQLCWDELLAEMIRKLCEAFKLWEKEMNEWYKSNR
jgi:hypothetical protein